MRKRKSAILMGDVISSQEYDQKYLSDELSTFRKKFSRDFPEYVVGEVVPKIGDEFQCLCKSSKLSLFLVMEMDDYLLGLSPSVQCRYVIADGYFYGDEFSPEGRLSERLAVAHESLHLKKKNRKRVSLVYSDLKFASFYEDLFATMDIIKSSWNPRDYGLILRMIRGEDYQDIANDLGKTKQQIQKRSVTLQIEGYLRLRKVIYKLLREEEDNDQIMCNISGV